jgi:UDP-3-O-[3-hydroxymyristoyl] glucosamine N-acyltransferase
VVAGAAAVIVTDVPSGCAVLGSPAMRMAANIDLYKAQRRLPRLMRAVSELQKAVFKSDKTP